jgi:hypothetical protein
VGRVSSVCIATRYGIGRSGDRIPVEATFSPLVQSGPEDNPASYTMSTGSLPGVKRPGRGDDHPPPSNVEVKESVIIYLLSLWAFVACLG